MRGLVHLTAAIAVAAVAVAFGRWLREPVPGGPLLALLGAAIVCAVALRHLYRPGGVGRRAPRGAAEAEPLPAPRDDRVDLNTASAAELGSVPGIGPVGGRLIVRERERNGPFRAPGDLARVAGFSPSRVRGWWDGCGRAVDGTAGERQRRRVSGRAKCWGALDGSGARPWGEMRPRGGASEPRGGHTHTLTRAVPLTSRPSQRAGSSSNFPLVRRACISSCARRASDSP